MLAGAIVLFAACSSSGGASTAPSAAAGGGGMDALIAAAKAEGGLNTIALPRSWCNYGELIDGFTAKYGIPINGLNPDGGSGDEIEAIKAN
jgi:putative spermidine/putrescine transport system substrate-binding protein